MTDRNPVTGSGGTELQSTELRYSLLVRSGNTPVTTAKEQFVTVTKTLDVAAGATATVPDVTLTPSIKPVSLTFAAPPSVTYGTEASFTATIKESGSNLALGGKTIGFEFGTQSVTGTTVSDGTIVFKVTPVDAPGPVVVKFAFDGDATHSAAQVSATIELARAKSRVAAIGLATLPRGYSHPLRMTLRTEDGRAIANRVVTFLLGGATRASAVTDANGEAAATVTIPATEATGPLSREVRFEGDTYYAPSSESGTTMLYEPTSFVVWGGNPVALAMGQRVQFFGHGWWQQVTGGDYKAAADFAGWRDLGVVAAVKAMLVWTATPQMSGELVGTAATTPPADAVDQAGLAHLCRPPLGDVGYGSFVHGNDQRERLESRARRQDDPVRPTGSELQSGPTDGVG
jgi:hypothetical protein